MVPAERILPTSLVADRAPARFGLAEVYAVLAAASFAVARFVPVLDLHYPCPFRVLVGIPCATCGMTHAFVHLAHGRVLEALQWSPLGAALAGALWLLALADLLRVALGWALPAVTPQAARRLVVGGLGALVANWAFLVWHGLGP